MRDLLVKFTMADVKRGLEATTTVSSPELATPAPPARKRERSRSSEGSCSSSGGTTRRRRRRLEVDLSPADTPTDR